MMALILVFLSVPMLQAALAAATQICAVCLTLIVRPFVKLKVWSIDSVFAKYMCAIAGCRRLLVECMCLYGRASARVLLLSWLVVCMAADDQVTAYTNEEFILVRIHLEVHITCIWKCTAALVIQ